jgi:hypothetical protein
MVGMAGSGKTTLVQRIHAELRMRGQSPYLVNLDPAVLHLPYGANIDVRDTVNYKEVMRQYELGPNGAIVTALNLFATRFDQVIDVMKRKVEAGSRCVEVSKFLGGEFLRRGLIPSIPALPLFTLNLLLLSLPSPQLLCHRHPGPD